MRGRDFKKGYFHQKRDPAEEVPLRKQHGKGAPGPGVISSLR
jgi:hypothetical protein